MSPELGGIHAVVDDGFVLQSWTSLNEHTGISDYRRVEYSSRISSRWLTPAVDGQGLLRGATTDVDVTQDSSTVRGMWTSPLFVFAASSAAAFTPGTSIAVVQSPLPLASEVRLRHQIYRGHGVTAFLLQIPPGLGSQMHRHDKDLLTVFIKDGRTTAVFEGSPPKTDALAKGTVRYRQRGFAHSTRNDGPTDFRAVLLEFDKSQGPAIPHSPRGKLLCTQGFCVEDVIVPPGKSLVGSGIAFFVPIGDMVVRDASGRRHVQRDGSIWRGRYGWSNIAPSDARVMTISVH